MTQPLIPENEEEILLPLAQGNEKTWNDLIEKYSGFLISLAIHTHLKYGKNISYHDAEDVVAEVWKNLVENDMKIIRNCVTRKMLFPTLCVLTRNRSIDRMRRQKLFLVELDEELHQTCDDPPPTIAGKEIADSTLFAMIDRLPPKQKTLIHLFFLQKKKYQEIHILTGIPVNSIGPTLARAIQNLRTNIESIESA
jgi:RNA polymerase sigma factor (sigma-70 family)